MNSCSIAWKMFRNNLRSHALYLAVLVFSVAVYYEFMFLKYSPEFLRAQSVKAAASSMATMTSVLMIVFLFFFLFYSSSYFLKQRKKEIAVYAFMGVSNRKIGRIFAIENLILGVVTVVCGLGLGILFSRLFMMAIAKVAMLDVTVSFTIPWAGVKELVIIFGLMFLGLAVWHWIEVVRSTLIDLIRDSTRDEAVPRKRIIRAILSIVFIGAGYFMSRSIALAVPVVIVVIIGTFWLFGALVPAVATRIGKSPKAMYKGVRLISVSNILFRIRSNYRSLAMMAVMTATTVTAFGTSLSLKYFVEQTQHLDYPWTFSYVYDHPETDARMVDGVRASGREVLDSVRIEILTVPAAIDSGMGAPTEKVNLVRLSDVRYVQASVGKRFSPEKAGVLPELTQTQTAYLCPPAMVGGIFSYRNKPLTLSEAIGGGTLTVVDELRIPMFGTGVLYQADAFVVDDAVWTRLAPLATEKRVFHGLAVTDPKTSVELGQTLRAMLPKEAHLFSYAEAYQDKVSFYGLFFFLGSFLSIVFLFATGSIFYFKILSEGLADRPKYEVLRKIGLTHAELKRAVSMQVGMSLLVPLAVGLLHSVFAVAELSSLLAYSLNVPMLWAIAVYLVCYGGIYVLTTRKFMRLVGPDPA